MGGGGLRWGWVRVAGRASAWFRRARVTLGPCAHHRCHYFRPFFVLTLASHRALALACLWYFTPLPPAPECSYLALNSCITFPTFLAAFVIFMVSLKVDYVNYATRGMFQRSDCPHLLLDAEPNAPVIASDANVKQNASALSGLARPRFLISSLPSIWIFPLLVNE